MKMLFIDQETKIRSMAEVLSLSGHQTSIFHQSRIGINEEDIVELCQSVKEVDCLVIEMYFLQHQPELITRFLEANPELIIIVYTTQNIEWHKKFEALLKQGKIKSWFIKVRESNSFMNYFEKSV